jgi:hypothetical protein
MVFLVAGVEAHDEVVEWLDGLNQSELHRTSRDGRIILLTTFRKQRNNERAEVDRARKAARHCAEKNP